MRIIGLEKRIINGVCYPPQIDKVKKGFGGLGNERRVSQKGYD